MYEPKRPTLVATGMFTLWVALLSLPMLQGKWLASPWGDQHAAGYAFRHWGAEWWQRLGHVPLWNPELFGGLPFVAAGHGDIFYPTSFLRLVLPVETVVNLAFIVHYILAGLFTYWLLRRLHLSWTGAVIGGLAYELSGLIASYTSPGHEGKLFASAALPPEVAFLKRDVDDILDDYRSAGRGKLKLVIADPAADSAALREARTLGIPPVQFNVLGQAELQVKEGYLGLAVRYADGVRTMPFLQQTNDLEYRLTSDIRALTHPEKTVIAFGEIGDAASARSQRSFDALRERLGSHYDVRPFGVADTTIAPGVRVIAVAGTPESLNTAQLTRLRAYLDGGGSLLLMAGGMQLQISQQGPPFAVSRRVGWNDLLKPYGVSIASDMVYDLASNVQVGIPAQFGQVLAPYPFWLRALSTKASPVNADLEAVLLPWASRIDTVHTPSIGVTPLFVTSRAGGVQETTVFLDPTRTFSRDSLRRRVVALLASPVRPDTAKGAPRGRVVVVGTGDFASDRYARNSPENIVFVENAVDWLAQDDALIAIRSKNRAPPPLVFTSAATRRAVKYGNVFGVPLLLVVAGVLRLWRRRQTTRRTYQPLAASSAA